MLSVTDVSLCGGSYRPKAKEVPTSKAPQEASKKAVLESEAPTSSGEKKAKKQTASKTAPGKAAESLAAGTSELPRGKKAAKVEDEGEEEPDIDIVPGAMDGFVAATKKKKKKLVEKTFMDDKGYLGRLITKEYSHLSLVRFLVLTLLFE